MAARRFESKSRLVIHRIAIALGLLCLLAGTEARADDIAPPPPVSTVPPPALGEEEPGDEEGAEGDDDELLREPVPEPEYRLQVGAGVTLPTGGPTELAAVLRQDFEWHPPQLAPFAIGIGGAEVIGSYLIGRAGLRAGMFAPFCDAGGGIRCEGSLMLQLGASFGYGGMDFDVGADADLRFGFGVFELFARGGFFIYRGFAFVDIAGGLGLIF